MWSYLEDGIRGIDANPGDSQQALNDMVTAGALIAKSTVLDALPIFLAVTPSLRIFQSFPITISSCLCEDMFVPFLVTDQHIRSILLVFKLNLGDMIIVSPFRLNRYGYGV